MHELVVLDRVAWTSPPLASFEAMAATIESRFGPPARRDLDSNGHGLFDAYAVRFSCGLEVVLWRFHLGSRMQPIDAGLELSTYEIHSNERDLEHIAFHLRMATTSMTPWTDRDGHPLAGTPVRTLVVMRTDDNGNDVEVKRVTSRCEAEALVHEYESRGHKQTYWISA